MRNNKIILLGYCLAALLSAPIAQAADTKIGYVNSVKLLKQAKQAEEATKRLLDEFEPKQQELIAAKAKLGRDEQAFMKDSAMMSAEQRQKKERDLVNRQRELKLRETSFNEEVAIRRSNEMEKVQNVMRDTIQAYGKENGYDLIFFEGVSYASDQADITDEIVKILNKD